MKNRKTMKQRSKEREERDQMIRHYYDNGQGLSMNQIVTSMGHSKHTVFRAIHAKGRIKANKK